MNWHNCNLQSDSWIFHLPCKLLFFLTFHFLSNPFCDFSGLVYVYILKIYYSYMTNFKILFLITINSDCGKVLHKSVWSTQIGENFWQQRPLVQPTAISQPRSNVYHIYVLVMSVFGQNLHFICSYYAWSLHVITAACTILCNNIMWGNPTPKQSCYLWNWWSHGQSVVCVRGLVLDVLSRVPCWRNGST